MAWARSAAGVPAESGDETYLAEIEADRAARRIAIIDHGQIISEGTGEELKQRTNTTSLEDAFLALTGSAIRDEGGSGADHMRQMHQMRHGGRR